MSKFHGTQGARAPHWKRRIYYEFISDATESNLTPKNLGRDTIVT